MNINISNFKLISVKIAKKFIIGLFVIFVFDFFFFAVPAQASAVDDDLAKVNADTIIDFEQTIINNDINYNSFPNNRDIKIKNIGFWTLTAYNSDVSQCDASPCITANGFNVCKHGIEDTVAVNFLPFGTKIRIPDLFGDRIFTVRDRMNSRFQKTIDIWMKDRTKAIKFGVKIAKIEVIEP
jgi:3D (Asp-Asp-Asp) domain-containing protein